MEEQPRARHAHRLASLPGRLVSLCTTAGGVGAAAEGPVLFSVKEWKPEKKNKKGKKAVEGKGRTEKR